MPSLTVENYVKAILQIGGRSRSGSVSTGELAQALALTPGSVSSMAKTLAEAGLVSYTPYEGVRLTPAGRSLALRVLRRHRLVELFLVETLGLSWDQVHQEAEHLEHAVSDFLVDEIDKFLGHPSADPHGDPIPDPDGMLRQGPPTTALADCEPGERFRVVRVVDQRPDFLRYLAENDLTLGATGQVRENRREAGVVTATVGERLVALGKESAATIFVEAVAGS